MTLAFGIGTNAALFSVLNALVLKRLPVDDPSRVVAMSIVSGRNQQP
jgi:hypothetical protein